MIPLAQLAIPLPHDVTLDHDPMTQRRCCDPLTSAACGWWRNVGEVGGGWGWWMGRCSSVCLFVSLLVASSQKITPNLQERFQNTPRKPQNALGTKLEQMCSKIYRRIENGRKTNV